MAKWREIKQGKKADTQVSMSEQVQSTPSAPLSSRLKAFLTDTFLITTPIFYVVIYLIMGSGEAFAQDRTSGWLMILIAHSAVILFFWYKKAQTPGMKAYDIKLVNNQEKALNFLQILIRYLATLFAVISLFLLFLPFFRKDKRTFQDLFSNTHIINE